MRNVFGRSCEDGAVTNSSLPLCPTSPHRLAHGVDLLRLWKKTVSDSRYTVCRCEESVISRVVAEAWSIGGKVSLKRGVLDSPAFNIRPSSPRTLIQIWDVFFFRRAK